MYLAHCHIEDNACPLAIWHEYLCQDNCSVKALDALVFNLMARRQWILRCNAQEIALRMHSLAAGSQPVAIASLLGIERVPTIAQRVLTITPRNAAACQAGRTGQTRYICLSSQRSITPRIAVESVAPCAAAPTQSEDGGASRVRMSTCADTSKDESYQSRPRISSRLVSAPAGNSTSRLCLQIPGFAALVHEPKWATTQPMSQLLSSRSSSRAPSPPVPMEVIRSTPATRLLSSRSGLDRPMGTCRMPLASDRQALGGRYSMPIFA